MNNTLVGSEQAQRLAQLLRQPDVQPQQQDPTAGMNPFFQQLMAQQAGNKSGEAGGNMSGLLSIFGNAGGGV